MPESVIERGALDALQAGVVAALNADHFFSDIQVLHERLEDLDYKIQQNLAGLTETGGSVGICAIVITPRFSVSKPNVRGPHCDVTLVVRIMENVLINMTATNGTKKPASLVMEVAANIIHHMKIPGFDECINVVRGGVVPIPNYLAYDVEASTQVKIQREES